MPSSQVSSGRLTGLDAVSVLTLLLILLFAVPSRLIFGPLGASGTPAYVLGMLGLLWWAAMALTPHLTIVHGPQPVRIAMLVFAASVVASYVSAMSRALPSDELRGADRGLLTLCAWLGIVLLVADGVPSLDRLDMLLRRLVWAATALAVAGLLQFTVGLDLASHIHVPGLTLNGY